MTTKRRNVALVIEGMGSSAASSAGIAWHYGKASIGTPGNYEWKGGTGSREGLIRPPDSVGCSVDRFECQLQGNAHTFELHASGLAKALFLGRPTRPRDVLSTAIDEDDTTVAFNGDFYAWSSSDDGTVVWIGDEAIKLGTYGAGPQFTGCTRGFWSTTACGQPAGMNVYAQNPKIINRRAQLLVYDRDAGTTTQAWQGFVQSLAIDNGIISVSCQDVWSRIVGAKINRKAIDHANALGRGASSGGQVVQDEQIIRAGGVRLPTRYTSGVHKISAASPKWHSFQAVGALFHAYDVSGDGRAYWRDRTSGASGDSAAQLGSFIDPDQVSRGGGIRNAPVYELFVVDRIRDAADGNSTAATRRSSSRYFESKPYHPVSISMQFLTSTWAGFAVDEAIAASVEVVATIAETYTAPVTHPTDAIIFFDETTARWQDFAGTTAVTTHGQSVFRIDNDGSLGGYWSYFGTVPTHDATSDAEVSVAFGGSGAYTLWKSDGSGSLDDDVLTILTGQGFEAFVVITDTTDTNTNRGVLGKWNVGGSVGEWILMHRDFNSPNAVLFGPKNYYNRGASGDQVNDGNPHILGGRVSTSDVAFVSIDGTDVNSGTTVTTLPSNGTATTHLGSYDTSGTTYFTGRIGELHVFDYELSGAQRTAMISYLSTKWGV